MATPDYPAALPGVSQWRLKPSAQVLASDDNGPRALRRRSRVPGALGQASWVFLETDFSIFRAWWKDTLLRGHKRFWIELPSAGGITWHVAQFTGPYKATPRGYRAFEVTAELEILDRQFAPNLREQQYAFLEDFESGFGAYTSISGNTSIYTVRAGMTENCMHCAPQSSGSVARIRRYLPELVTAQFLSFRFRITAANSDDGCIVALFNQANLAAGGFIFNPIREGFYDATRRPWVYFYNQAGTQTQYFGHTTQVTTNAIYRVEVTFSELSGQTQYVLINENTGGTVHTFNPAGVVPPIQFDTIQFDMDSGALTSETDYDDIYALSTG